MSTVVADKPQLRKQIRNIIRKGGPVDRQIDKVADLIAEDSLRREYVALTIRALAEDITTDTRRTMRKLPTESFLSRHREAMIATGERLGLFEDYTVGGKRLGDCYRDDLLDHAKHLTSIRDGADREIRFVLGLAEKMGTKKVRETWKQDEAERLKRSLSGE